MGKYFETGIYELPAGTVVQINGMPVELIQKTLVETHKRTWVTHIAPNLPKPPPDEAPRG